MARLPAASCWTSHADLAEVKRAPDPDFTLSGVRWPVQELRSSQQLQPFRDAFRAQCNGTVGLPAALCVSSALARAFPWGAPKTDLFAHKFDPIAHLKAHLAGEPGHCVTRSGILVNELLSVGIPARVVQLFTQSGRGHNVVEVWDAQHGWVLVDPSFGGALFRGGSPISAAAAIEPGVGALRLEGAIAAIADDGFYTDLVGGDFSYAEPWLHLRFGKRAVPWPFHARLIHVGAHCFSRRTAPWLLRFGTVFSLLIAGILLVGAALGRRKQAQEGELVPLARTVKPEVADGENVDEESVAVRRSANARRR